MKVAIIAAVAVSFVPNFASAAGCFLPEQPTKLQPQVRDKVEQCGLRREETARVGDMFATLSCIGRNDLRPRAIPEADLFDATERIFNEKPVIDAGNARTDGAEAIIVPRGCHLTIRQKLSQIVPAWLDEWTYKLGFSGKVIPLRLANSPEEWAEHLTFESHGKTAGGLTTQTNGLTFQKGEWKDIPNLKHDFTLADRAMAELELTIRHRFFLGETGADTTGKEDYWQEYPADGDPLDAGYVIMGLKVDFACD